MIYFTADLHFGHANVIRHCNRPFASADEMDAALTHNWNSFVGKHDEVYILGDFTMKPAAEAHRYLSALNGRKYMIRGNHDHALGTREMSRFHPRAKTAMEWTRKRILEEKDGEEIILAISHLPQCATDQDFLYVHGSPAGPTMDYLLPGDSYDRHRMQKEFDEIGVYAFNGHSHIPGVIVRGTRFMPPEALEGYGCQLQGRQMIVNVGSVGQPRDGNPKSCYVTVEGGGVWYHRVEYDAESVCKRILAIPQLDPFLGQRLLAGY